jgi:hypothetical protein
MTVNAHHAGTVQGGSGVCTSIFINGIQHMGGDAQVATTRARMAPHTISLITPSFIDKLFGCWFSDRVPENPHLTHYSNNSPTASANWGVGGLDRWIIQSTITMP